MNTTKIQNILNETAYVRTGGSKEEIACAKYLQMQCEALGMQAVLEPFEVDMAELSEAKLIVDEVEIPCKGYLNAGNHDVEAPFYYLRSKDQISLKKCHGKIVLIDEGLKYWTFKELMENRALGVITFDGNVNYKDDDIDQKELRSYISEGKKLPCVNINAKSAVNLVKNKSASARIVLKQHEFKGISYNVVADIPGELDEWVLINAHYDSTSLSTGAYDDMSGCIGALGIAEYFVDKKPKYGLRFVWHGSEERGLLGAKAYCAQHEEALKKIVLNVNMDMIGCIMGKLVAVCASEEKLVHYLQYMASELGVGLEARDGIRSTDATVFSDYGIPSVSFARYAPGNTTTIHNRYDTLQVMSAEQLQEDINFICAVTERLAMAANMPVERVIPEKIKDKIDVYMFRKRG